MRRAFWGLALAGALPMLVNSCVHRPSFFGPRLTGTCSGACEHYVACKPGHSPDDRKRCQTECPTVFGDRDSLMAFESLSCKDTIEYVDGTPAAQATTSL